MLVDCRHVWPTNASRQWDYCRLCEVERKLISPGACQDTFLTPIAGRTAILALVQPAGHGLSARTNLKLEQIS